MLIDAHVHLDKYGDLLDEALKQIDHEKILTVATAMDVPSVRMGQLAAEILHRSLSALDGAPTPEPIRMQIEESLIVRESSGPPPQH